MIFDVSLEMQSDSKNYVSVQDDDITELVHTTKSQWSFRGGSRISKGVVDGRPHLLRGARENALTKKIGNNFSCTCLRRVFLFPKTVQMLYNCNVTSAT